ncbi:ABC transporter permease [Conexibacter sp. SYSU D00693]|uniref:ABC transporter permease n=1 Tax=Conexibacter sp. SYSU D00693 TaxID=2812560 RepID=UPI001F122089|nr:ABC transporter permease [Conexibacter sp. SYSU D00693]
MEAARIPSRDRVPALTQGEPSVAGRAAEGWLGPVRRTVDGAGEFAVFVLAVLQGSRGTWRSSAEVLRQAGIYITGSALVIWGMQFVIGSTVGTEAAYILRGYGAQSYSGVFTAWATIRVTAPLMFGYILAAKVGCGLVAEIGSMRINDEIDGMKTMGVDPMRYLIATRVVAALLAFPFIYAIGIGFQFLAEYLTIVVQIGEISSGAWSSVHWQYQNPRDLICSIVIAMVFALTIVLVGLFYGYRATGGPAGVGAATARSMVVNLVLVHVLGALFAMLFWGFTPNAPVGG